METTRLDVTKLCLINDNRKFSQHSKASDLGEEVNSSGCGILGCRPIFVSAVKSPKILIEVGYLDDSIPKITGG